MDVWCTWRNSALQQGVDWINLSNGMYLMEFFRGFHQTRRVVVNDDGHVLFLSRIFKRPNVDMNQFSFLVLCFRTLPIHCAHSRQCHFHSPSFRFQTEGR